MNLIKYTILLLCFSLAVPLPLIAGISREEQRVKTKASRFFSRGEILFDEGNYSKAAEAFLLAYETYPHPSTLVNIGLCYERAGWLPKAVETYQNYVSEAPNAPDTKGIREKIQTLSKLVGEIVITCPSEMGECVIQVDGTERGKAPVTVLVEPGRRKLTAFVDGTRAYATTVAIDAGESRLVKVDPEATAETDSGPSMPQTGDDEVNVVPSEGASGGDGVNGDSKKSRISMSTAFWVATGVTIAATAATIVFGVRYARDIERFEDSDKTDLEASRDGDRDKLVTNILIGVTSASAAVAISFAIRDIVVAKKKEKKEAKLTMGPGLGLGFIRSF